MKIDEEILPFGARWAFPTPKASASASAASDIIPRLQIQYYAPARQHT